MGQPFVAVPSYFVPVATPRAGPAARPSGAPPPTNAPRHRTAATEGAAAVSSTPAPVDAPVRAGGDRLDVRALGPLAGYATDPETTDLFVNGESGLWIDAGHGLAFVPAWQLGEAAVRELAVRLIALGGRHIDEASPCVDVRLGDGIRVHAVLPPVSSTGTLLSIRLPQAADRSLGALADAGLFGVGEASTARLNRLRAAVRGRQNLLVTGAAGSGNSTWCESHTYQVEVDYELGRGCRAGSRVCADFRGSDGRRSGSRSAA